MLLGQAETVSRAASAVSTAEALLALAALLLLSAGAAWGVSRLPDTSPSSWLGWFAGFASVAVILALTLFRDGMPSTVDLSGIGDWSAAGVRLLARDPFGSSQFLLNVVLFVPAGAFWTWLVKRPWLVVAALVAVSLLVESVQAVTGTGAADLADLVANGLGAALGAALGTALGFVSGGGFLGLTPQRRQAIGAMGSLVLLVIVTVAVIGAGRRVQALEESLRSQFAGTDLAIIEAQLASDPNGVFGAVAQFADGSYTTETRLEVRYPATFFGLQRCVYVIWTAGGVEFYRAAGDACTRSMEGGGLGI